MMSPSRRKLGLLLLACACLLALLLATRSRNVKVPSRKGGGAHRPRPASRARAPSSSDVGPTRVHVLARGFTCFENLYAYNGLLWAWSDPRSEDEVATLGPSFRRVSTADYLSGDGGALSSIAELPPGTVEELARGGGSGGVETWDATLIMNEWQPPGGTPTYFTSHYGHFVEEVASGLLMQAAAGLVEGYTHGLCGRCEKHTFVGEGQPLNTWVMQALWNASWRHATYDSPIVTGWGEADLGGRRDAGGAGTPRVLHLGVACMVDRYATHRDWHVDAVNNCNTLLMRHADHAAQLVMEGQVAAFRASPFILHADLTGVDEGGQVLRDVLRLDAGVHGPLVTVVKRLGVRSFEGSSFDALVAALRAQSTRVLVLRWELLPGATQMAVASATDVMVGMQGNGLSHLMWMKRGGGVLEFFPHFSQGGESGTVWTNDWPYLTRAKGLIYRAVDCAVGAGATGWGENPVAHPIHDAWELMSMSHITVDVGRAQRVIDGLFDTWRAVRGEVEARGGGDGGWESVDMRAHWHPAWRPEEGEEPFYAPQGWHPNHKHRGGEVVEAVNKQG